MKRRESSVSLIFHPRASELKVECAPLAPAEADACAAIHADSFASPWSPGDFAQLLASRAVFGDGAFLASNLAPQKMAGFCLSRKTLDEAEILSFAVAPKRRAQGVGSALLKRHLHNLAFSGVACVFLEVDAQNAAALAVYRKNGFSEVGRRKAYYARKDGPAADALMMKCAL